MSGDDCYSERSDGETQSAGGDKTPDGGRVILEAVFRCLSSARRRTLLYYLREHPVATVDELARHVGAVEDDQEADQLDAATLERVTISLVHQHLPLLADASVVDYDSRSETVRYTASPTLESFLTLAHEVEHGTDSDADEVETEDTDDEHASEE